MTKRLGVFEEDRHGKACAATMCACSYKSRCCPPKHVQRPRMCLNTTIIASAPCSSPMPQTYPSTRHDGNTSSRTADLVTHVTRVPPAAVRADNAYRSVVPLPAVRDTRVCGGGGGGGPHGGQ